MSLLVMSAGRIIHIIAKLLAIASACVADAGTDRYRPEAHYMRGPGPAWRAKHEQGAV
jgi:hypothetical protein